MFNRHESNYKVGECGKVNNNKSSDSFDLLSLRYNFIECGGTIEEFEMLSVGEVIDFIYTYINMRSKTTKQNNNNNNNNNRQNNRQQEDTIFYGRVDENGNPMTLEQIMAME